MGMSHVSHTRRGRGVALVTAVATAAVLALPAAANAWPQVGADGGNTHQATTAGPADPGFKWISDVSEDTGEAAPDGFSFPDTPIVVGSDGILMRRADADGQNVGQGNRHIVGIDPADGSLSWNIPFARGGCDPALDSDGNAWAVFVDGADGDDILQRFDAATGERVAGSEIDPVSEVDPGVLRWCEGTSLHIGGAGSNERAILFDGRGAIGVGSPGILAIDVSGDTATEGWVIDPDDAPFGRVMRNSGQQRIGAMTDAHLYVPTVTGDDLQLTKIALADGNVEGSVTIPVFDNDEEPAEDASGVVEATVMIHGSTAVVTYRGGTNGATAALTGVNLDTFAAAWTRQLTDEPGTQRGARVLARSGDNVISGTGTSPETIYAHDIATGEPTSWSRNVGTLRSQEYGQHLTDSQGTIYINTTGPEVGPGDRSVAAILASGTQQWRFNRVGLLDASGLDSEDLNEQFRIGAIDADGTLYLHRDEQIIAIDNSGGLSIEDQCQLPFDDVSATSVHAANICRLVELEVTGGTTPTTYSPNQQVTRAQMATFLTRALSLPAGTGEQFPDVDPSSVHARNILSIRDAGITQGRADGTYDPNGTVTRAEMASFLARAAGLEGVDGTGFNDVDPNNVHTPNIYAVRDAEITTGTSATTYNPDGNVRRDQMASFLIRMIDFINEG